MISTLDAIRQSGKMDEWNARLHERVTKSTQQERPMSRVSFANLICPIDPTVIDSGNRRVLDESAAFERGYVSKRARKGEVPNGMISGDPVIQPHLDEDDDEDDTKSAMKAIKAEARRLDEDEDADEDEKKRKLKAFAKRWGVVLRDADEDEDERKGKARAAKDDSADADDDDDMDEDDRKSRGIASRKKLKGVKFDHAVTKVSFGDIVMPSDNGGDRTSVYVHDVTQPDRNGARAADMGVDALGRTYADEVLTRLGGGLRDSSGTDYDDSAIPVAGGTDPWLGDSRTVPNSGAKFMPRGEGDQNHSVDDRGGSLTRPRQDYQFTEPDADDRGLPARLGNMRVMNPGNSGIAGPSAFRPTFRDGMLSVLKASRPRRAGTFRSLIEGDGRNPDKASVPGQGQE